MKRKNLPVRMEFEWKCEGSCLRHDPWTIAFVFPRRGESFLVKGGKKDVVKWIMDNVNIGIVHVVHYEKKFFGDKRTTLKCFILTGNSEYSVSLCKYSQARRSTFVEGFPYSTAERKRNHNWRLCVLEKNAANGILFDKWLRNPPMHWVKQLDPYTSAANGFMCALCEHAIHGPGGRMGISGCKLTAYALLGKNCPLKNNKADVQIHEHALNTPEPASCTPAQALPVHVREETEEPYEDGDVDMEHIIRNVFNLDDSSGM